MSMSMSMKILYMHLYCSHNTTCLETQCVGLWYAHRLLCIIRILKGTDLRNTFHTRVPTANTRQTRAHHSLHIIQRLTRSIWRTAALCWTCEHWCSQRWCVQRQTDKVFPCAEELCPSLLLIHHKQLDAAQREFASSQHSRPTPEVTTSNNCSASWRLRSVVTMSVSRWLIFPNLRLICGWHVTTSWVKCPLWVNQPGQLSLPSPQGR